MAGEDHIRKALDRALTAARGQLEQDLRAFAQDLVRSSSEERARAVKDAAEKGAAEVRRQALEQLTQLRDATQKHVDELRRSADAQVNELKTALDGAKRSAAAELAEARARCDATVRETEKAADERVAAVAREADRRVAEATRDIESIRASARAEAEELVVSQIEASAAGHDRAIAEAVERARTDSHQTALAQAARLANAVRAFDEAGALGDVLAALGESAAQEVERAAVFLVKDERLTGWRLYGFQVAARSVDLSLDEAGLPGSVVRTGVAVSRPAIEPGESAASPPALPPFAQDAGARHALALPVTVGGTVIGVLYADAPRLDTPSASSRWPAVLDVLARHAGRVLEAMTVQRAAGLSLPRPMARGSHLAVPGPIEHTSDGAGADAARRCARLLVSEIRMFNEPVVDAGRQSRDLLARLGGEIDRARRIYESRVPADVEDRMAYFDQELVRTLADGDRSLLGSAQ